MKYIKLTISALMVITFPIWVIPAILVVGLIESVVGGHKILWEIND